MRTNWDSRIKGREWPSVEAFGAGAKATERLKAEVKAMERLKAEAEGEFRRALALGFVLVEHWLIGSAPSQKVWTGAEYANRADGYDAAAHVANRFRAGWTRVEIR